MLNPIPVQKTQQVNWLRMQSWLRDRLAACQIPGLDVRQEMRIEQCTGGHSNLTYFMSLGEHEFVIRLPPSGPLPPAAHDMAREYRWLSALHPVLPLAPRPYVLCEDLDVVGSVFYVMERRHGIVVRTDEPPPIKGNRPLRRRVGFALVDTLASLHGIDIDTAGLSHLGKPGGFVRRQVRGWSERWERFKTSDVAEIEAIAAWLNDRVPPEIDPPGIVHGDFKLDNILLDAKSPDRVVAIFDWEMSALGEPLVDLGMLLVYWGLSAPPGHQDALTTVTDRPGWPSREEVIDRYATRSRRRLDALSYFEVLAFFKIAVVLQQIYYRHVHGQADDPRFAILGSRVMYLVRSAIQLIERT